MTTSNLKTTTRILLGKVIPEGDYCYKVVSDLLYDNMGRPYHQIEQCPFCIGHRPDTTCKINPNPNDWVFNIDACKGCGINQNVEYDNL